MACVICLGERDARRVCQQCSASMCRKCLAAYIDRGMIRCCVCGSKFLPSSLVRACALGLAAPGNSAENPGRAHLKLGIAYAEAADARSAISCFETAQRCLRPSDLLHHLCSIEMARVKVKMTKTCDFRAMEQDLVLVANQLLGIKCVRGAFLYSDVCALLGEIHIHERKLGSAQVWLKRAIAIQSDLGPPSTLASTLRILSNLLVKEERYPEAKAILQSAEEILLSHESDPCVLAIVQAELATIDIALGEKTAAREALRTALRTLRKRCHEDPHLKQAIPPAAKALSRIVTPARRLRQKTACEEVKQRPAQEE